MDRPGIGRVSGDCIILDGTTVEEVRDHHAKTLALVVEVLNDAEAKHRVAQQKLNERQTALRAQHQANVRDVADAIRFE